MIRDIDENLIRPEKLMSSSDMAKLGCNDCAGCSECCKDRASAITLDEWDVSRLKEGLHMTFDGLLSSGLIEITMVNNILLPSLGNKPDADECIFLGEDGRCRIHNYRPGICRMFPLARLYHEDGSFSYFLQDGECSRGTGVKIKISKWLGVGNINKYEQAVRKYHDSLTSLRQSCANAQTREEIVRLQKDFLQEHFGDPIIQEDRSPHSS